MGLPQVVPGVRNYDVPLIGDDLAKIGRIIDIWADPCSPTPTIWVLAFWQAIPTLFITLTKPELIDIDIKKGGHRPRKGRRMKFRADHLFRDSLITIPVPRWVPFILYEWGQRIGWYFLVADALEDFAINWMSLAYKWEGCQGAIPPYVNRSCEALIQGTVNGTYPMILNLDNIHNVHAAPGHFRIQYPGDYTINWTAVFYPYTNPPQSEVPYGTVMMVDQGAGYQPWQPGEGGGREDGGFVSSGSGKFSCDGNEIFWLHSQATKDGFCFATASLSAYASDYDGIAPDP